MSYHPLPDVQECRPFFSRQYYFENPEFSEVHDPYTMDSVNFSESDGYLNVPMVHSVPSHDIQELYIRESLPSTSRIIPSTPQYRECCLNGSQPIPNEYIREMKPRLPSHLKVTYAAQSIPRGSPSSYQADVSENMTNYHEYRIQPQNNYFRSSSTIPLRTKKPVNINGSNSVPMNVRSPVKSFPASGKTGRYIRRPVPPTTHRNLASVSEPFHHQSKTIQQAELFDKKQARISKSQEIKLLKESQADTLKSMTLPELGSGKNTQWVKKMNSEGDAPAIQEGDQLDTNGVNVNFLDENETEEMSEEHKEEIKRLSKLLIPRVPSSVKAMKQKQQVLKDSESSKSRERIKENIEAAENTPLSFKQSLNSILDQLENCEISLNAVKSKYSKDSKLTLKADSQETLKAETTNVEIFNLKDISERMSPKLYEKKEDETIQDQQNIPPTNLGETETTNKKSAETTDNSSSSLVCKPEPKNSLDDLSALELHRSKSYIVGLIDRALSKELGTIPEDRIDQFKDLSPKKVIKQLARNYKSKDNIPETMKNVGNNQNNKLVTRPECRDSQSSLSNDSEPSYIKQLKELRWGHFRHIQQEVRRLEDLERFLDNCGAPCPSAY